MSHTFHLSLLLGFLSLSTLLYAGSGTIIIQGKSYPIDTIESYQVGPGTTYSRYEVRMSSTRTVKLYMLDADLNNPYLKVEQRNAQGVVGKFETVAAAHQALDAPNHRTIGNVNCNFFWTSSSSTIGLAGNPTGGTVTDGVIATQPDAWNMGARNTGITGWDDMGYVAITRQGRCLMDNYKFDGKVYIGGGSYPIVECNRQRIDPNNDEIALFNYKLAPETRTFQGIEILFSVDKWCINGDITCTVTGVNATGGTRIPNGQGALQCRGSGADFVRSLNVGATFKMNLGFYSTHNQSRPDIMQLCMGNALCMAADTLTQRNYNEDYNTQVYARTGMATNTAGTRLWLLVMQTPGMSTAEMCSVFKAAGATYAVGCDGGGSAQLGLYGVVQNKTTEATPRALNNGLWLFSTAPDRTDAGQLAFVDPSPIAMPGYASYTPKIRAYTKEGNFLTHDFQQFTLSCTPSSLGTISADGRTFTANATNGKGTLTASYGNASVSKSIIIQDGQVRIRLDSVWIGNNGYAPEVLAISGDLQLPVAPEALTWRIGNTQVLTYTEGSLMPLTNGASWVWGRLGQEQEDSLFVTTQLASAPVLHADGSLLNDEYPSVDSAFTLSKVRNITIPMAIDRTLYGCPDSMILWINSTAPVSTVTLALRAHNAKEVTLKQTINLSTDTCSPISIHLSRMVDLQDQGIYPITLNSATFALKDPKKSVPYTISIRDIQLHYSAWNEPMDIQEAPDYSSNASEIQKRITRGQLLLYYKGAVYSALGQRIQ